MGFEGVLQGMGFEGGDEVVTGALLPEGRPGGVEALSLVVHGQADARTGEETGPQAGAEQHPPIDGFLEFACPPRNGSGRFPAPENAEREMFLGR
ncbi:hypothetical protein [Streptomyces sp. V2I9]|uniref:hypothetical protein n=1 Tax=Streptomyces sp. V2I9 TaxID=3042304 RepID=UPI002783E4E3|nr:hypothetical protein [Streptomyces sp. V2I9]MDQ0982747.1 hypothetical protein [Streptomyces sp. V2I9]